MIIVMTVIYTHLCNKPIYFTSELHSNTVLLRTVEILWIKSYCPSYFGGTSYLLLKERTIKERINHIINPMVLWSKAKVHLDFKILDFNVKAAWNEEFKIRNDWRAKQEASRVLIVLAWPVQL